MLTTGSGACRPGLPGTVVQSFFILTNSPPVDFGSFEPQFGTWVVVVEFAVGVIVNVLDRARGVSPPVLKRHRKVVPVSLQQSLIDLFIVTVIAALTPIVAGLLSRLRVPQAVLFIVGGILVGPQVLGGLTRPALNWYPMSVSGSSSS